MNGPVIAAYLLGRIVEANHISGQLGAIRFMYDKGLGLSSVSKGNTAAFPGLWLTCRHDSRTQIGFLLEEPSAGILPALALDGYAVHAAKCPAPVFRILENMWSGVLAAEIIPTQLEPGETSESHLGPFRKQISGLRERSALWIVFRLRADHTLLLS